jgi:hypothetical protein
VAKGKTSAPLRIWVWHSWIDRSEVGALHDQGHLLSAIGSGGGLFPISPGADPTTQPPDLILHPAAHQWNEFMFQEEQRKDGTKYYPYLDAAITAGRKRKRETKG